MTMRQPTARQIREQAERDQQKQELAGIVSDEPEEALSQEECCRQAGDLSKRLRVITDQVRKFGDPITGSDLATFEEILTLLDRLAANGSDTTEESLRDSLSREQRTAERRQKRLMEWLTR
jgi:hypothetical protein